MTESGFQDHFSGIAGLYHSFRPRYPSALFEYLASVTPARTLAWDCATGSGQAAVSLAAWFDLVIATDTREEQIVNAEPHKRVIYRVASAAESGIDSGSLDLITVAQALHWFRLPEFYAEARRVLKPEGVLAVWTYGLMQIEDENVQKVLDKFYYETVGPYWPPQRKLVDTGYRDIDFPFTLLDVPEFIMESAMVPEDIEGYLRTWSATRNYQKTLGQDPLPELMAELIRAWDDPEFPMTVEWPLTLLAGRIV